MTLSAAMPRLTRARELLAHKGLLALFGSIYLVSQVVIAVLVHPLGTRRMVGLQLSGFSAADYRSTFAAWEAAGTMPFYRAHLIFDDLHWIWYAIALSAFLALALKAARLSAGWNFVLLFPVLAGIQDCIENGLQHVFLSQPGYSAMIDPLPAISTAASIGKWILFIGSFLLIGALYLRAWRLPERRR
jgi:hypothetical protein